MIELKATAADREKALALALELRTFLTTKLPELIDSLEAIQAFGRVTVGVSELADDMEAFGRAVEP